MSQPAQEDFRDAMAELPAGVTVVTAWDGEGGPAGATVSAVSSLSLEPAMLLVCLSTESDTGRAIAATGRFLVHVLCRGQEEVAQRFATKSAGKFDEVAWREGTLGLPELSGCAVVVGCDAATIVPGGDHVIIPGSIREIDIAPGRAPLVYHRRRLRALADDTERRRSA